MNRLIVALFIAIVGLVLIPGLVLAQDDPDPEEDTFLLRVNGTASVPAGETVDAAVMINGDIVVDGTIADSLIVVRGTAIVTGSVGSNITVINGDLELQAGSTVDDVMLISSDLVQDPAATVSGDIEERSGDFSLGRGFAIFSILWWVGMLILGIAAGAVFAWLGRSQLYGAVRTLRSQFVPSLITALLLWIVLPVAAVLIIFTLVGAPLGISILMVLLPVLLLVGLIVVGAWIGSYIVQPKSTGYAIGSAILGIVIVALISLIPFVAVIVALAGMLGSGALVYRTFKRSDVEPASPAVSAPSV